MLAELEGLIAELERLTGEDRLLQLRARAIRAGVLIDKGRPAEAEAEAVLRRRRSAGPLLRRTGKPVARRRMCHGRGRPGTGSRLGGPAPKSTGWPLGLQGACQPPV